MQAQTESLTGNATNAKTKTLQGYRDFIIMNGHEPTSISAFCKELNIAEEDFRIQFNSFEQVAEAIWANLLAQVISEVEAAKHTEYTTRTRLLSFYREFFIQMKKYRSYAIITMGDDFLNLTGPPKGMGEMKEAYKAWIKNLIDAGIQLGEVANRSKLTESYDILFWFQFLFLFNFWKSDKSTGFEKTDVAIEKSTMLTFDLIEKNALDSALEFGKFIFQFLDLK